MINTNKFEIERKFSKIENLQKEHYITYAIFKQENGVLITVTSKASGKTLSSKCLCPNLSVEKAQNIVTLLSENSFGINNWLNIIEDLEIDYVKIN